MAYFPQPDLPESFAPCAALQQHLGRMPRLFAALGLLPELAAAAVPLTLAIHTNAGHDPLQASLRRALDRFLWTLANGLGVENDLGDRPAGAIAGATRPQRAPEASLSALEELFGFAPALFRAQASRPDALDGQAAMLEWALAGGQLSRLQKERLLLVAAAAHRNAYFVELHARSLEALGLTEASVEALVADHRQAALDDADVALLDFAIGLVHGSADAAAIDRLRQHGVDDRQALEAVGTTALASFLDTLQIGIGTAPDFAARHAFPETAPLADPSTDPDAELVAAARRGSPQAFEELVRRHHRRLYRAALCVTGHEEDAEDAAQVAFVKAFQSLQTFERHALFTTWLTRIVINEALSRVRARKPTEHLPLVDEERSNFRPALLTAWVDDPEQLYARAELRDLIERAMSDIPVPYRMAVLLRDVEQLSTAEAASALNLPIPTLKKHLTRGRLLLREALAPYFASGRGAVARV